MQTSAPSSITATDHRAATSGRAGSSERASAISAAVVLLAGHCWPVAIRASTLRTLVSRTACRWPNAKLATAAAVYEPTPGSVSRASTELGTSPPCRSLIICAASCRRSARSG